MDKRFYSTHLEPYRRTLYQTRRDEALRACGPGTTVLANRLPTTAMGAVILMDPAAGHPDDSNFLTVAGNVTHRLKIGCNTVGRQQDNDLVIRDDRLHVSRRHCAIVVHSNGRAEVFDTASLNGTFLNGRRLTDRAWLRSNDIVRLGSNVSFSIVLYNPIGN